MSHSADCRCWTCVSGSDAKVREQPSDKGDEAKPDALAMFCDYANSVRAEGDKTVGAVLVRFATAWTNERTAWARSARPLPCDESLRVAEKLEENWKEIAALFQERNWPDTKIGNAASAINWNLPVILKLLRTGEVRSTRQARSDA